MNIYGRLKRLLRWTRFSETTVREAIEELIEENNDDLDGASSIDEDEKEMLGNVLNLRDTQVRDIMVQRVEIKALSTTAKIDELVFAFVENQISSIIVYQGTLDNVIGVVYLKDIVAWFRMNKPFNITIFVKDIIFIPPTMKTLDLLMKMKETGIKIAIVVDEYGGVDGLISVHDLVEEIIGDIQDADELKNNKQKVTKNYDGTFTADAKTTLIEFAKTTGLKLTSVNKQIDSIGGYIISKTGKVPVRGELISCPKSNVEFEVLDADSRKIKSVKIKKLA